MRRAFRGIPDLGEDPATSSGDEARAVGAWGRSTRTPTMPRTLAGHRSQRSVIAATRARTASCACQPGLRRPGRRPVGGAPRATRRGAQPLTRPQGVSTPIGTALSGPGTRCVKIFCLTMRLVTNPSVAGTIVLLAYSLRAKPARRCAGQGGRLIAGATGGHSSARRHVSPTVPWTGRTRDGRWPGAS